MNSVDFESALHRRATRIGLTIPADRVEQLFGYFELLRRWNATINLTALELDPPTDETLDRLLIEPLAVAARLEDSDDGIWFDLGSGGGSPAVPMKIVLSRLQLTMVESKTRKAAFLREAVRALHLDGTAVENVRFETLRDRSDLAGSAGLITVRAVRVDPALLALASWLLRAGGSFVAIGWDSPASAGFECDPATGFLRRLCST